MLRKIRINAIAVTACLVLVLSFACLLAYTGSLQSVYAASSGDFEYTVDGGNVTLTKYNGKTADLEIPASIGGKPVTKIGESCFAGNIYLKNVTIPDSVSMIDKYGFEACSCLESVNLANVKEINKGAFSGCSSMKTAALPAGLKTIGDGAFYFCYKLSRVDIPASLETLGDYSFSDCSGIKTLKIAEGNLKKIGNRAFYYCGGIQSVEIPANVKEIGKRAFEQQSESISLQSLSMPAGIVVDDYAFKNCTGLSSNDLAINAKSVGVESFSSCSPAGETWKKNFSLAEGVETISDRFFFASGLSADVLTIPASLTTIEPGALEGLEVKEFQVDEGNPNYKSVDGVIYTKDGKTLVAVPMMYGKTEEEPQEEGGGEETGGEAQLTEVQETTEGEAQTAELQESVEEETPAADIPAAEEELKEEKLPAETQAAAEEEKLTVELQEEEPEPGPEPEPPAVEFVIPDGVVTIAGKAFSNVSCITSIVIPDSVTTIGNRAFDSVMNDNLVLTISENVTSVGEGAFCNANVKKIVFNASIDNVPEYCFEGTGTEEGIIIGPSVKRISKHAFERSGSNVEIPATVEEMYMPAFIDYTGNLTFADGGNFTIDQSGVIYSSDGKRLVAYVQPQSEDDSDTSLKSYTIKSGVQTIDNYAFLCADDLKTLNVPGSVKSIGEYAVGYKHEAINKANPKDEWNKNLVTYTSSEAFRKYAHANDLACFSGTPSLSRDNVSLKGGESVTIKVNNAKLEDVAFTSSDKKIATVDSNGKITGQRVGSTVIVASVGHKYFKCKVTVTSRSPNPEKFFNDAKYVEVQNETSAENVNKIIAANQGNVQQGHEYNVFTSCYKEQRYYEAIWSTEIGETSRYDKNCMDSLGDDYRGPISLMSHGLHTEMKRYNNPTDLVLFSGNPDIDDLTGTDSTILALQSIIGKDITNPYTCSTAIDQYVGVNFGDYMMIVYADKEVLDKYGGYIEYTVGSSGGDGGEYELLMNPDVTYKVLDAGVREVSVYPFDSDDGGGGGEANLMASNNEPYTYEQRYIKLLMSEKDPEYITDTVPNDGNKDKGKDKSDKVKTGDQNYLELYSIIMALAMAEMIIILEKRRRNNK